MMDKSTPHPLTNFSLRDITTYQAGAIQASVHRTLQKHCDEILKPYGITKMHWLIIGSIIDSGEQGARITDIAKKLDTTLPYLTNTLNVLEARQIVTRANNQGDSRSKLVKIDPTFLPQCAEIEKTLRDKLRESIYAQIDPAEFLTYMKVMHQLANIS
jgi:DNA-binding MarR family transcriptional regulator